MSEKKDENSASDINFTKVKIKEEKPSPPSKKIKDTDEIANEIIPNIFSSIRKSSTEDSRDEKKSIEPVKSSNEILAELFKVFNAAPPESLLNDKFLIKKHKKHKSKDKKHKRKLKKHSKDSSDEASDGSEKSKKRHKKKKRKKSKKRDSRSDDEHIDKSREKECNSKSKDNSEESDFVMSEESEYTNYPKPVVDTSIAKEEKLESSPKSKGRKIIIQDLKNSSIFKEAEKARRKSCEKMDVDVRHNDNSSDISLSDEETYLREKEEQYKNEEFYARRRHSRRSDRRRYSDSPKNRFRSRWRESRSRSVHRRRIRSRSRSHRSEELVIDKKRLLEIARKNAITMFNNGSLPGTQSMSQEVKDKVIIRMRYGGKTVEELTEFCKKLSKGESMNDLSSLSSNEDSDHDKNGNEKVFHHPFVLKDRGPIVMNIKNATPIPPKTAEQTKAILMQYPVSSGQLHRQNENEWIPVSPKKAEPPALPPPKPAQSQPQPQKNVFEKPLPSEQQLPAFTPLPPPLAESAEPKEVEPPPPIPLPPSPPINNKSVFPQSSQNLDVSSIITQRLNAMRKLQENPTDPEALKMMYNSQREMSAWATSKFTPGQFTGSTGANILSARELTAGQQAWAKRIRREMKTDQLTSTAPVSGGMGMHLLQKMGWRPGEGLGKKRNGTLQPLLLEIKLDKRGFLANEEDPTTTIIPIQQRPRRKRFTNACNPTSISIENKHPVSLLGELSAKRKWGAPSYDLVNEEGPAHHKNFIFKVTINGVTYQPSISSTTKKDAKALAAKYCLQQLGILPT